MSEASTRPVIAVDAMGGEAVQSKCGHAFIKERMRLENAVYGGEMSAHHYFRDFACCDSGMIPWLLIASAAVGFGAGALALQVTAPDDDRQDVKSITGVSSGVDGTVGYTRVYGAHISWRTPTQPLAKEINPRLVFDRMTRIASGRGEHGFQDGEGGAGFVAES